MRQALMPPPYDDVEVGAEIPVRATYTDEGKIRCEATYRGDPFGAELDPEGLDHLQLTVEIDRLVSGVAGLVWNELYGTPVFDDDDDELVARVATQKPWEGTKRRATQGWIRSTNGAGPERESEPRRDAVATALGDADVSELRLTQDEMAALMRGEIPASLTDRLLKARSTENLLASASETLAEIREDMVGSFPESAAVVARVIAEINEVRSRFEH